MSVRVAVRTRPLSENELKTNAEVIVRMNGNEVSVVESVEGYGGTFLYDSALWSTGRVVEGSSNAEASQAYVYDAIGAELLEHIMTGYNGCIFAYGQTGSGKTYCMMGTTESAGLIPRIAQNLFEASAALRSENVEVCVEVSYYEIYNEKVRCLLRPTQGGYDDTQLRVREHPKYGPFIEGLAKFVVRTQGEFLKLMSDGNKVRTTASTAMNATSSRSHAVFAITLTQKQKKGILVTQKTSRLNLVDLAGSERASKSLATGKRLTEGSSINLSLTCLGNVISALAEVEETGKSRHIPYRDSTLTWILKDNLGGNSKTVMLATISPSSMQYEETMSTLRYAERAKKIVNKAVVNETNNNELVAALQKEISFLRSQLVSASTNERERLLEELEASEAVKKELTSSLEEKLADTKRLMEEREEYMRGLEAKLNAQMEEIEHLRVANDEKERRIDALLRRIQSLDVAGSEPNREKVEEIREQVAALEQEQKATETHMRERQKQIRGSIGVSENDDDGPSFSLAASLAPPSARFPPATTAQLPAFEEQGADEAELPTAVRAAIQRSRTSSIAQFNIEEEPLAEAMEEADDDLTLESHHESVDEGLAADEDLIFDDELEISAPADSDLDELLVDDSDLRVPPDSAESERKEAPKEEVGVLRSDSADALTEEEKPGKRSVEVQVSATAAEAAATPFPRGDTSSQIDAPALLLPTSNASRTVLQDAPSPSPPHQPLSPSLSPLPSPAVCDTKMEEVAANNETAAAATAAPVPRAESLSSQQPTQQGATIIEMQVALEEFFTKSRDRPEIYAPNEHTAQLVIPSHALPNNRFLREAFRVSKMRETDVLKHKKDRIWEIDMFSSRFSNLDTAGVKSFDLPTMNLFRVEKNATHSRRLALYFFDAPHPYELEFTSTARRQQFFELSMLLRRNSILWCPSLCLDGENDVTITVRGTTIDRPSHNGIPVSGEVKMTVARMPYEVIDLWYGCFSLDNKPLPHSTAVFSGYLPKEQREIYVIGVTDVPASLLGTDELGRYFLAYLGTVTYFVLANTAITSKKHQANNAVLVLCKRSFIVRVANIELFDNVAVHKDGVHRGDFSATGCALRINESSIGIILVNTKPGSYTPSTRAACIRTLLSSFPFADAAVDISMRFDYFVVSGAFHFGGDFSAEDALIREILSDNLMSNMREMEPSATLRCSTAPLRIFYSVRPSVSRMDVSAYSTSRALGLANAFIAADVFCQRSFLSLFGETVPHVQILLERVTVSGARLPSIGGAELQISMDAAEGSPMYYQLTKRDGNYIIPVFTEPCLQPCVSNLEYLRLQTLTFTVLGSVGSMEAHKRIVVASGVFPLKSVVLAEPALLHIPLYYRGCTVGKLTAVLHQLYYERNSAEVSALGFHDARCVTLVTCFENEIRRPSGRWVPASPVEGGVCHFSSHDPTQARERDEFLLPDPHTWRWLTEWQHDQREDDSQGWVYADGVEAELQLTATATTSIRRRRWTRMMQASNPIVYHGYLAQKLSDGA
ncbi:putative Unc104-like kinesin [Leptomonas pyrrhocoris]|uniref:Putative Unc104-like kinesin n=1 Tax=Leptomonas pyrrhocoris TaxID=157538 RepID=A0A0N0DX99_LEPPY|nr:putative Unc104-like kinesin [Leptomonas pyrrhocoris]KPA82562.1 putative Unc104-like kinesin [Leptomonas pyrrhocoris]|eukprot:XP_015661001.1 putative Unc104-like kinesin [Leptomonas pyrrhocoris]